MKAIMKLAVLLALSACMAGCDKSSSSRAEVFEHKDPMVMQLGNIVSDTPVEDAERYLALGHKQLWGYQSRNGMVLPGIDPQLSEDYAISYGVQVAPAMGDIVIDEVHQSLRRAFKEYAATYNQRIIQQR